MIRESRYCPLCGSTDIEEFCNFTDYKLKSCKECELIFRDDISTLNTSELIDEIYDQNWIKMRDDYAQQTFLEHAAFNIMLLEMFAPSKGLLLEIGCGTGEFLYAAYASGWSVAGVEPSLASCRYAREKYGLDINNGVWDKNVVAKNQKFDAVVFWHVLEHIKEPIRFLKEVSDILKPGGLIFFSVPNVKSFTNKIMGINSPLFTEKDHLFHYSVDNLRLLLSQTSLDVVKLFCREEFGRLNQEIHISTKFTNEFSGMSLKEKIALMNILQSNYQGYELFCICRKKASNNGSSVD